MSNLLVGDLVRLVDTGDKERQLGIIISNPHKKVHFVGKGEANIVQVYWPQIDDIDWEYTFFLEKLSEDDLTDSPE